MTGVILNCPHCANRCELGSGSISHVLRCPRCNSLFTFETKKIGDYQAVIDHPFPLRGKDGDDDLLASV